MTDITRESPGSAIRYKPQWYCKQHLEQELGAPVKEQSIFPRTEGMEEGRE